MGALDPTRVVLGNSMSAKTAHEIGSHIYHKSGVIQVDHDHNICQSANLV